MFFLCATVVDVQISMCWIDPPFTCLHGQVGIYGLNNLEKHDINKSIGATKILVYVIYATASSPTNFIAFLVSSDINKCRMNESIIVMRS